MCDFTFIMIFQIASTAKGRGVLRLLLIKHQINLLCIPAIFIQLLIAANQSGNIPSLLCFSLEIIDMIVTVNCFYSGFLVVLGRYIYKTVNNRTLAHQFIFQVVLPLSRFCAKIYEGRKLIRLPVMDPFSIFWNSYFHGDRRWVSQFQ